VHVANVVYNSLVLQPNQALPPRPARAHAAGAVGARGVEGLVEDALEQGLEREPARAHGARQYHPAAVEHLRAPPPWGRRGRSETGGRRGPTRRPGC
jgi:hypothetical protein